MEMKVKVTFSNLDELRKIIEELKRGCCSCEQLVSALDKWVPSVTTRVISGCSSETSENR